MALVQPRARRRRARRGTKTPLNGLPRPRVACHVPEWPSRYPGNRPDSSHTVHGAVAGMAVAMMPCGSMETDTVCKSPWPERNLVRE